MYYTGGLPKPLFPWETNAPKPTRVFVDDLPPPPAPKIEEETASTATVPEEPTSTEVEPPPPTPSSDPWNAFTRTNAWDDNAAIEAYVRSFKQLQAAQRRGQVQVLHQQDPDSTTPTQDITSPQDSPEMPPRRESLILTDFPNADDRPSLPVTPAPVHRQTFWGIERDGDGNLPPAQGVPEQAEWDPREKLEELRRNSLIKAEDLPNFAAEPKEVPKRRMPSTSMSIAMPDSNMGPPVTLSSSTAAAPVPRSMAASQMSTSAASAPAASHSQSQSEIAVDPLGDAAQETVQLHSTTKDLENTPVKAGPAPIAKIRTDTVGPFDEYSIA